MVEEEVMPAVVDVVVEDVRKADADKAARGTSGAPGPDKKQPRADPPEADDEGTPEEAGYGHGV
jgi:hypothetical protein